MFYDLSKSERAKLVAKINQEIEDDLKGETTRNIIPYFMNEDTYIRKNGYLAVGRIYKTNSDLQKPIISTLKKLLTHVNEKVRQTVVNSAGEIGKVDFGIVQEFMDVALFDKHHSVRNAVIGSIKKMGQKNPVPVLNWAKTYLKHSDQEIRREICHGIELRGRTHPEDILPLLKKLEFDKARRVSDTLIHVLGQISYKKGCLRTVVAHLNTWENKDLVKKALDEIVDVHERYKNFSALTQEQAIDFIVKNYNEETVAN